MKNGSIQGTRSVLEDFIDNAPVGVFRTCSNGRIALVNSAFVRMLAYPDSDTLLQVNAVNLCSDSCDSALWMRELRRHGVVRSFETRLNCHCGAPLWVELHARAIYDEHGAIEYYEGVAIDISQRKRAEEVLITMACNLEETFEQTVFSISRMMERRDPYTAIHQRRTAHLATAIARELRLEEMQVRGVFFGALIHDIGKLFVPLEFLCHSGSLGENEMELIRRHTQSGFEVLKNITSRWPIPAMVQQHHERIDGTGYPYGLGRRDILIESSIIAVADTVEAMSGHRPYRPSLGIDVALSEIRRGLGRCYEDSVCNAALRLFDGGDYKFTESAIDVVFMDAGA